MEEEREGSKNIRCAQRRMQKRWRRVLFSARSRSTGHKLEHKRLHLNTREHLCTELVTGHWHRLPQEAVGISLEISKNRLDVALGGLLWVSLLEQGWDQVDSRGPCQPLPYCHSVIKAKTAALK